MYVQCIITTNGGGGGGGGGGGPIQLPVSVRGPLLTSFNQWEVGMGVRGGQLQTSLYKLKSRGGGGGQAPSSPPPPPPPQLHHCLTWPSPPPPPPPPGFQKCLPVRHCQPSEAHAHYHTASISCRSTAMATSCPSLQTDATLQVALFAVLIMLISSVGCLFIVWNNATNICNAYM